MSQGFRLMTYDQAIDDLLDRVFRPRVLKPRLRKDSGMWECASPELSAFAPTASDAFALWRECMDLGRGQLP